MVQESANVNSTGHNGGGDNSQNVISLLERVPYANGDGELLSVDDEISGAGTPKPASARKDPKTKNSSNVKRANVHQTSLQYYCKKQ